MTDIQSLTVACIATVIYPPVFMVVFDRIIASSAKRAEAREAAEQEIAETVAEAPKTRRLRGLAAEPTVLPRAILGGRETLFSPVSAADDALPGLLASLEKVPSSPRTVMA
jgi:hypothetical protein